MNAPSPSPSPSRRIRDVVGAAADGWEVYYRARDLAASGVTVVNLTIGDHDVPTPRPFLDAMIASATGKHATARLGYAPVPGYDWLRATIAKRVTERTGVPTGPQNVAVTPGGQAALFMAMMAAVEPGDGLAIVDPHYATFPQTVRSVSGRVIVVPAHADDAFRPRREAIAAAFDAGARALLINSPNNPTGVVYGADTLEAIAAEVRARSVWLISDELYDGQVHGQRRPATSPRALPDMAERTMVIGSMSKSHGMTGFRLGWVIGPEATIARVWDLAIGVTYGVPGFIQEAADVALRTGASEERAISERYAARARAAIEGLSEAGVNSIRAVRPEGGMYVFIDVRAVSPSGEAFAHALLDAERIAVMPGESFGQAAAGHLRVALTAPEEVIRAAMARLAAFAASRGRNFE